MSSKFFTAKFFKIFTHQDTNRLRNFPIFIWLFILPGLMLFSSSCNLLPSEQNQDKTTAGSQPRQKSLSVDVAVARLGSLKKTTEYVGTTFPVQEVSLRSRLEGQLLDLTVDVGDQVQQGQVVGKIDDSINRATVLEAEAELAALQSEITSLEAGANEGSIQIKQAKITLQQAKSDLVRSNQLVKEGAVTEQSAEQAQYAVDNAQQALKSAQQQLANRRASVVAAQRRAAAQSALVNQEQKRESFTVLTSPITGSVLERILEPGNLAQPGNEILRLGDFSQIQIRLQISELELAQVQRGQKTQVKLDAFPQQTFTGEVTQVSLTARDTARLVPIEVTIPNLNQSIGGGLLARVNFGQQEEQNTVIPATAIEVASNKAQEINDSADTATIFVIQGEGKNATVAAREVELGDLANSQVEILAGLEPGEKFVVRSSGDLKDGDQVNFSFLSES